METQYWMVIIAAILFIIFFYLPKKSEKREGFSKGIKDRNKYLASNLPSITKHFIDLV
jgi:hypothetical protein